MSPASRPKRSRIHSWVPFGLGETKPHHFKDMLRIIWQNRDRLGYAWKVLSRGTCDGCALGTTGLKDWTIDGTHLCMVRLELLRLNTIGALNPGLLTDVAALRKKTSRELREFGRLPHPMRRRRGEPGFTKVSWSEVWNEVGRRWRELDPDRTGMFLTSRGITNEVYYVAQKVMRYLGSNHVDNSARLCHSPSTAGLKATVGVAATTCSYKDWFDADLIVFFGSNPANDQPVSMKYLHRARKNGARVLCVNAYREPGMKRYWVPSDPDSALFGTPITDRFYEVRVGGDLAFLLAVQKRLVADGKVRRDFIDVATEGFEEFAKHLEGLDEAELCELAGTSREEIQDFADEIAGAERGVLVWSMGVTQHAHGAETVKGIAQLGMLKEWVGRPGCGLMPIRGHSGVQGGAEMGAYSTAFPGGVSIEPETARRFSDLWGFEVPDRPGRTTVEMLDAAHRGELDGFYCIGGNFLETMPDPDRMEAALGKIGLRIHSDIMLSSQMLVEPADTVFVLPACTRYEQRDGGTETTTERRVVYSPEIPGHRIPEARSEWEMLMEFAKAVRPEESARVEFPDGAAIRSDIARAVPSYAGIENLRAQGDQFQWGGPHLCAQRTFPTHDGKAHFQVLPLAGSKRDGKADFVLATRRGKQFNSMIQAERDPLTGADRDHVFMHPEDARALGLRPDQGIRLVSETGTYEGRVFFAEVTPGTLQGHWPEVNPLIRSGVVDAGGGVPDYNARVTVEARG